MVQKLRRVIQDGLLAISVLCGAGLWLFAFATGYSAWLIRNDDATVLMFLWASFVSVSWALWGITSGPWRLRVWWFGLASFLNMLAGVAIGTSGRPHAIPIGVLFLSYSLWQFIISQRSAPPRWPQRDI